MNWILKTCVVLSLIFVLVLNNFKVECQEPVECKNDNDCVIAGLTNSHCREVKHVLAFLRHHSECEPKRGT